MTNARSVLNGVLGASPIARLWRRLEARLRPAPIATTDALKRFLEERAALIAQKCAIDYCRGKTGLASYALFTEEPFLKALDICRWETFAVVLGDLIIMTEGCLRPHVPSDAHPRLWQALIDLYAAVLTSLPAPAHRPQGWSDVIGPFDLRFRSEVCGEPRQALDVADHSAKRLFDTLPIHASMRVLDQEVVYGAVRFRMIAARQEMQRRIIAAELVGQLLG